MGILNCTPDSFYDGKRASAHTFTKNAIALVESGADIIDIGGESSRPGANPVSLEEEKSRVLPIIKNLIKEVPNITISIDTYKAEMAKHAIDEGVRYVNDIKGNTWNELSQYVSKNNIPYICMHMQGEPETMQLNPQYHSVVKDIIDELNMIKIKLLDHGLASENLIWDPGIGFGKSLNNNLTIMKHLNEFSQQNKTLLGVSRKSYIANICGDHIQPKDRLPGSLAPLAFAIKHNIDIVRVHDVRETKQFLDVYSSIDNI